MRQRFVIPKQVKQADLVSRHRSKVRGYSLRHQVSGYHQFAAQDQYRDAQSLAALLPVAVWRATPFRLGQAWPATSTQTTTV
jgi:hypothetical protein